MTDDQAQANVPRRVRLSELEGYALAYEVLKLHRELSRATRDQVLDALHTAREQNVQGRLRARIEDFERGLLKEWLARA